MQLLSIRRNGMAQIILGDKSEIQDYPFQDEVHDMADFILAHQEILGAETTIISRELQVPTVAGQKRLDFLAFDGESGQIDIIELKNSIADEKVLLQTLRYANWIRNNPDTVRYQIKKNGLNINAEDIEPDSIKIVIIAPKLTQSLTELCQYITAFDFEFIQLQRFKDKHGKVYAVTERLEVEAIEPTPPRGQGTYDFKWYEEHSVREHQLEELKTAIEKFSSLCDEKSWNLNARYVKWSVRFQTPGGRNAFCINVRKTQNHHLTFCLGDDFDLTSLSLSDSVIKKIHHKKGSRWWKIDLAIDEIKAMTPLIEAAYQNILR
jgi:hypothetical protein